MDGGGGKADNLALQLPIDHRDISPEGGEIEDWREEVVRSVLVGHAKYVTLDFVTG